MYVVGRSAKWLLVEVVGTRVVAFNMDEASASSIIAQGVGGANRFPAILYSIFTSEHELTKQSVRKAVKSKRKKRRLWPCSKMFVLHFFRNMLLPNMFGAKLILTSLGATWLTHSSIDISGPSIYNSRPSRMALVGATLGAV